MSLWFRRSGCARLVVVLASAAGVVQPSAEALAAETYIQPQIDLRAEGNDNFDLVPGGSSDGDVYGFVADAKALIGIATPRSETTLRPRLRLQEYPDRDDRESVEGFLDLRSKYDWERAEFLLIGRYAQQDTYNTETLSGEFDPLDPSFSGNLESRRTLVGETRKRLELNPTFKYELTERVRAGVGVRYENVNYESDALFEHTDYEFMMADASLSWSLTPLSEFGVGTYASQYRAKDDSSETDSYGAGVGYNYRWSEVTGIEARVFYEKNDVTNYFPVPSEESTSNWGGDLTAYRKFEVSDWRFAIGRNYIPTGDGGKSESDLLRLQYRRNLSERLAFNGTGRYEMRSALTTGGGEDRDYARADLSLEWFMTPTWYVRGGYSYVWEDRQSAAGDAANNVLFVSVGYKGLGRQRR